MDYTFNRKDLGPGAVFCTVHAERFKTACASVSFLMPLGVKASLYALIPNILSRSCEKYPTLTALEKKFADLYGAQLSVDVSKLGERQVLKMMVSCIGDRFSLDGTSIVGGCFELLTDLVFSPLLVNGSFSKAEVESEKRLLSEQLGSELSDKRIYAKIRCEELMCENEAYGIGRFGTAEEIEKITPEALTEAYREVLSTAVIGVSVCGAADTAKFASLFAEKLASVKRAPAFTKTVFVKTAAEAKYKKETEAVKQGKLVLGFRAGMDGPDDRYAQRRVMADLFGGSPHSKLFTVVREKMSLCYYCSARLVRQKGIMLVQSGIETFNEEKAKKGILDQLAAIQNGDFTDDALGASIKALTDAFCSVSDCPESLDAWFMNQLSDNAFRLPEDYITEFEKVTRDDVIAASRDVTLDTVFMLAGETAATVKE